MNDQLERDRAAVLRVWPNAAIEVERVFPKGDPMFSVIQDDEAWVASPQISGDHPTEAAAWADAARRLKGEG